MYEHGFYELHIIRFTLFCQILLQIASLLTLISPERFLIQYRTEQWWEGTTEKTRTRSSTGVSERVVRLFSQP